MHTTRILTLLVAAGLSASHVARAADPVAQCRSGKNKAAGSYDYCRQKAEAKVAITGDTLKYGESVAKCVAKFQSTWTKVETAAAAHGATCLDGAATGPQFATVIDDHTANVASALAGGVLVYCGNGVRDGREACDGSDFGGATCVSFGFAGGTVGCTGGCGLDTASCLPIVCGDGAIDPGEQCDQSNLNGETCAGLGFDYGSLACGAGCVFDTSGCYTPRFTDNGDGTITDHETGLMWEKKADFDGVPVTCTSALACPNPHDADNQYTWTDNTVPTALPTGTAFTVLLAQLNAGGGFAGHTDWRLPTLAELHATVDYADATSPLVPSIFDGACTGSCSITTCSCTAPSRHWSDSSVAGTPTDAWVVDPGNGEVVWDTKDTDYAVRAVRTGP